MTTILKVALAVPLDRVFDYAAAKPVAVGCRVRVPFGRREVVGVVVGSADDSDVGRERLKSIAGVLDDVPLLGAEPVATLTRAARYYHHPLGEVMLTALPAALRSARALPARVDHVIALTAAGRDALEDPGRRRGTRIDALLGLLARGPARETALDDAIPRWRAAQRTTAKRGWTSRGEAPRDRRRSTPIAGPTLNDAQREAAEAIVAADGFEAFLLDGVTGSGKTEVYLAAIRSCLERGTQALVLLPEIALTPQALRRFRERLGVEIAAFHSGLGESERAHAWLDVARGDVDVVLGTRSAVFVPLARPGLIVVDEEHDASYKQQDGFRYHARDLAVMRAQALEIPIVLGSATPSLESLANVAAGRYRALRLAHRAGPAKPPSLRVIDLRGRRLDHGLAPETLDAIAATIARDEQVLVFRNRRGYAPVLLCHDCGWSAACPRCERALTWHRSEARLRCHHCGYARGVPSACPDCGGLALQPLGAGTQRIEETLRARFADVPIVRVDRDSTRGRRARDALFESLPDAGARILVGTQMLAKGHDLAHLTLVVVLGVDEGLKSVDFRAGERLGQLIVQVAGRAGRAERPGSVILQTHAPDHPLLGILLRGGYRALAAEALEERRAAELPPFAHLALLRAESADSSKLDAFLADAAAAAPVATVALRGPMAAPMPRRAGVLRGQILIESDARPALHAFLDAWLERVRGLASARAVRWSIDVDPIDMS